MRILVAVDGSDTAKKAFEQAKTLIVNDTSPDKELYIMTVVDGNAYNPPILPEAPIGSAAVVSSILDAQQKSLEDAKAKARELVKKFEQGLANTHVKHTLLVGVGQIADVLVEEATTLKVDMMVLGTRGLGTLKRAILGSVSSYCVHNAPCNVLIVRA